MKTYAPPLMELLEALERLPGIGPRSAERIGFFLLRAPKEYSIRLSQAIARAKESLQFCRQCFNLTEETLCEICREPSRDAAILCVVEEPKDLLAIEKTGTYRGLYHVLLGAISPLEGFGPELLKIDELLDRCRQGGVEEVILATDADKDGEITAAYLSKQLRPLGVRVSRIASGIPVGSHLEYADKATLSRALEGRRDI